MKAIHKYWREALCLATLCFFLWSLSRWITSPPESLIGKYLFLIFSFLDLFCFVYLLRWLWLNKWRERMRKIKQRFVESTKHFLAHFFEKLIKKWNIGKNKKNIIVGNTKIVFDEALLYKEERGRKKTPKYKQLKSDRERLRFLYRAMIIDKIRSGERIYSHDTPSELKARKENTENVDKLFAMYIGARYNEDAILNENEIQRLKNSLESEFAIK